MGPELQVDPERRAGPAVSGLWSEDTPPPLTCDGSRPADGLIHGAGSCPGAPSQAAAAAGRRIRGQCLGRWLAWPGEGMRDSDQMPKVLEAARESGQAEPGRPC